MFMELMESLFMYTKYTKLNKYNKYAIYSIIGFNGLNFILLFYGGDDLGLSCPFEAANPMMIDLSGGCWLTYRLPT